MLLFAELLEMNETTNSKAIATVRRVYKSCVDMHQINLRRGKEVIKLIQVL